MRARSVAASLCLLLCASTAWGASPRLAAGTRAPAFTLPARSGTVALDSLRGRVVLVDFWASWCGPCRESFPWMGELQRRLGDKGLTVLAVNLDKRRDLAEEFLAKYAAPFTVAFDAEGRTAELYGVRAMPTSLLLGRDGVVLATHAGFDARGAGDWARTIEEACTR
jgi:cytochrome c biogenesis protein CcmG/thiol:disulfide interchange protein DsbE